MACGLFGRLRPLPLLLLPALLLAAGCSPAASHLRDLSSAAAPTPTPANVFDAHLAPGPLPADGFDFPVGDPDGRGSYTDRATGRRHEGWYEATQFADEFGGDYGGHWIKLNYPNPYDAARGRAAGLLSARQEAQVAAAWGRRAPTPQDTGLGGGIGFHGRVREWDNDGPRHLSWGCVVLHLYDIERLHDLLPEGTMVVIF